MAGAFGWQALCSRRVALEFTNDGGHVPPLHLSFFPAQLAFTMPSPPPSLGELALSSTDAWVGSDLVPGAAVIRYEAAGFGAGYRHVRLGETARVQLRAPRTLAGRVVEPVAVWFAGWRCIEQRPVAGAEVIVMGGGEHGVVLAAGRTDADGHFAVDGVDLLLDGLGVRVRAPGFAIAHRPIAREPEGALEVAVARTGSRLGRIDGLGSVDPTTLRVLARGLPGVEAVPAVDGTFALDHVPADMEPRLLLLGLPGLMTHRPARAGTDSARIEVLTGAGVRGRVVDATTNRPLAGALVFCGDDEAVRSDDDGQFELTRLLPGTRELRAQYEQPTRRRRSITRSGRLRIQLPSGAVLENVVVTVE